MVYAHREREREEPPFDWIMMVISVAYLNTGGYEGGGISSAQFCRNVVPNENSKNAGGIRDGTRERGKKRERERTSLFIRFCGMKRGGTQEQEDMEL